jgi:hypothetical protein
MAIELLALAASVARRRFSSSPAASPADTFKNTSSIVVTLEQGTQKKEKSISDEPKNGNFTLLPILISQPDAVGSKRKLILLAFNRIKQRREQRCTGLGQHVSG